MDKGHDDRIPSGQSRLERRRDDRRRGYISDFASVVIVVAGATSTLVGRSCSGSHCAWLASVEIDILQTTSPNAPSRLGDGETLRVFGQTLFPI